MRWYGIDFLHWQRRRLAPAQGFLLVMRRLNGRVSPPCGENRRTAVMQLCRPRSVTRRQVGFWRQYSLVTVDWKWLVCECFLLLLQQKGKPLVANCCSTLAATSQTLCWSTGKFLVLIDFCWRLNGLETFLKSFLQYRTHWCARVHMHAYVQCRLACYCANAVDILNRILALLLVFVFEKRHSVHLIASLTSVCIVQHHGWNRNTAATLTAANFTEYKKKKSCWPIALFKRDTQVVWLGDPCPSLASAFQTPPTDSPPDECMKQRKSVREAAAAVGGQGGQGGRGAGVRAGDCGGGLLPRWPWPWCRRTCLECLSQSDTWVEMWFPPHLQSHNYRFCIFFFPTSSEVNALAAESHQSAGTPCPRSSPCSAGLSPGARCTAAVWSSPRCTRLPVMKKRKDVTRWLSLVSLCDLQRPSTRRASKVENLRSFVSFHSDSEVVGRQRKQKMSLWSLRAERERVRCSTRVSSV